MKWSNLKNNKCPKCNADLSKSLLSDTYRCSMKEEGTCDFLIATEKFEKIVNNLYKPKQKYPTFEDNMSELNNM